MITICNIKLICRYLLREASSVTMVEVDALSGYQFDEQEAYKLAESERKVGKVEVENKDTRLNIYCDQVCVVTLI